MTQMNELAPMLRANDIQQTIAFYRDILGFVLDGCFPEDGPTWCSVKSGRVRLMFFSECNADSGPPTMTGVVYIYVDDVLSLHERIADKVEVQWGPEVFDYGMHEFAIKDCNGYTLSFGQPTDAEPTCKG